MYSLNLGYKQKTKKITLPKTINHQDLLQLIASSFRIQQKVIGLTNTKGQLITTQQILSRPKDYQKEVLFLITTQDMNDDNMSFASDHGQGKKVQLGKEKDKDRRPGCFFEAQTVEIPQRLEGYYQGVIGDLELFQSLFLQQVVSIVFCFVKEKPKKFMFPYYLYHTGRNSAIIYQGQSRVCQFFIESMCKIPKEIEVFVSALTGQKEKVSKQMQQQQQNAFVKVKSRTNSQKEDNIFGGNDDRMNGDILGSKILYEDGSKQQQKQGKFQSLHQQESEQQSQQQVLLNGGNNQFLQSQEEQTPNSVQVSLLQNLLKLKDDQDITQLQFYKMKSQLLENLSDFMRKYQMGTRKGLRGDRNQERQQQRPQQRNQERPHQRNQERQKKKNQSQGYKNQPRQQQQERNQSRYPPKQQRNQPWQQQSNQSQRRFAEEKQEIKKNTHKNRNINKHTQNRKDSRESIKADSLQDKIQQNNHISHPKTISRSAYSRQHRRTKKYQIPIIVRKYNNVIEKISTSYPLTQEQQQSINLILELELKGLISERQSAIYKSSILQEDQDVFPLFEDYLDNLIDQLQLVAKLKKVKNINSEKKERSQHNMRLLIKYSRQQSYELLRNLLIDNNHLLIAAFDKFQNDKNVEILTQRLQKIASVYRQKEELEEQVFE